MQTRLTRLLGIQHPIVLPGMTYIAVPRLVAAVSHAGGLGILASGALSPEECRAYLDSPSITWIHVEGCVTPDTLQHLGGLFGLHPLALEDVLNTGQRTKLESYEGQLFLVMHLPAESVIPITVPGNPAEHVAYFVLLDINGNPLNVTAHDNYYDDIRNQIN